MNGKSKLSLEEQLEVARKTDRRLNWKLLTVHISLSVFVLLIGAWGTAYSSSPLGRFFGLLMVVFTFLSIASVLVTKQHTKNWVGILEILIDAGLTTKTELSPSQETIDKENPNG